MKFPKMFKCGNMMILQSVFLNPANMKYKNG